MDPTSMHKRASNSTICTEQTILNIYKLMADGIACNIWAGQGKVAKKLTSAVHIITSIQITARTKPRHYNEYLHTSFHIFNLVHSLTTLPDARKVFKKRKCTRKIVSYKHTWCLFLSGSMRLIFSTGLGAYCQQPHYDDRLCQCDNHPEFKEYLQLFIWQQTTIR